jgi:hypothetical protein
VCVCVCLSLGGFDDGALSQSSMATLADLAEQISSPQPQHRHAPFRHIFQGGEEASLALSRQAAVQAQVRHRHHSTAHRTEAVEITISIIHNIAYTFNKTDWLFIWLQGGDSDTDADDGEGAGILSQLQGGGAGGLGGPAHSLSLYPPLSQISNLSSDLGNEGAASLLDSAANSTSTRGGKELHRKPSFLPPGAPYDGGGFKFMSGLSQEE